MITDKDLEEADNVAESIARRMWPNNRGRMLAAREGYIQGLLHERAKVDELVRAARSASVQMKVMAEQIKMQQAGRYADALTEFSYQESLTFVRSLREALKQYSGRSG